MLTYLSRAVFVAEILVAYTTHPNISPSGFKEQIYDVYRYLPPATQVCLISATLPHEILEMTNKFMTDPIRILVKRSVVRTHLTLDTV